MKSIRLLSGAAICVVSASLSACRTTPAPQTPEIVEVHANAPVSANPLVGINLASNRAVQNVRVSIGGKTFPRSASGAIYTRLVPGTHLVTVGYDVYQSDGTLAARSTRQQIQVPDTRHPVVTTIQLP